MVAWRGTAYLKWEAGLQTWTLLGYGNTEVLDPNIEMDILTPRSTVAALRAGYRPQLHPSAGTKIGSYC